MAEHSITIVSATEGLCDENAITAQFTKCIEYTLAHQNVEQACDIYVMLTDDAGIRELNAEHRNIDKATDVLSFPMLDLTPGEPIEVGPLELDPETGRLMLGDMVISVERAKAQAEQYGHSLLRELCFLGVHSVLHMLGYDHEKSEEDEKIHFALQEEILSACGITRDAEAN